MYDENSFKNYIFWLKVKRIFLIILFSIIGTSIGVLLSQFLIDILLLLEQNYKIVIIIVSTLLFFSISLLLTAGTGKEVQEGYWKMAVLRKLTVISKKLDSLENLNKSSIEKKELLGEALKDIKKDTLEKQFKIEENTEKNNSKNIEKETNSTNIEKKEEISNNENIIDNNATPKKTKKTATKKEISKIAKSKSNSKK
ncbi:MAG: hypothetical protein IKM97_03360 [Clostridia bacterium]|nr:hypothetical protein [Clostridia bacterium]